MFYLSEAYSLICSFSVRCHLSSFSNPKVIFHDKCKRQTFSLIQVISLYSIEPEEAHQALEFLRREEGQEGPRGYRAILISNLRARSTHSFWHYRFLSENKAQQKYSWRKVDMSWAQKNGKVYSVSFLIINSIHSFIGIVNRIY